MARGSLTKKIIHGRAYYYLRYTGRVDGKPKVVRTVYLGRAEEIVAAVQNRRARQRPKRIVLAEFGAVAAIWSLIQQTGLIELVDAHLPKRAQGPSVGQYLAMAVVNRVVCPKSKRKIGPWLAKTILPRLTGVRPKQLTSQRFWDHMDRISLEAIEALETKLAGRLVEQFGIDRRCLAFDATNFFTFIDTRNTHADLAQRGHNKNGRYDLRQISLALLVSTDFHVPLFHETYEGNRPDAVEFRSALAKLQQRWDAFLPIESVGQDLTLVFDKGNNSTEGFEMLDTTEFHFVGSLCPTQHPDLLAVPHEAFQPLPSPRLEQVSAYRTTKEVFGAQRTVVVTFNDNLYTAQLTTLTEQISKARRQLDALQRRVARHRSGAVKGKSPTLVGTQHQVKEILKARHVKDIIEVRVADQDGGMHVTYRVRREAIERLCATLFGKTIIFTDQPEWSNEQIVLAYRGQYRVEHAFRTMKDPHFVSFSPCFHWTNQKIRVHAFYCVLALLMVSLLQRELHRKGIDISVTEALESLSGIKEVALFHNRSEKNPAVTIDLTERDELQNQLFEALHLERFQAS
jgi:transposase